MAISKDALFESLASGSTADDFRRALGGLSPMGLSARQVSLIARAVEREKVFGDTRVALCGTHTFDPLPTYLRAHGAFLDLDVSSYTAPYGQYMQELLTEDSKLCAFDPQVLLISCALRQFAPRLHGEFSSLSAEQIQEEKARLLSHLEAAAQAAVAKTRAIVLIANFPRPSTPALGVADAKRPMGEMEFYLELNLELLRRFKSSDRVHVFDLDAVIGGVRLDADDRHFYIGKRPWGDRRLHPIARKLMRYVVAASGRTRKCLVLDLDNTLWGGVVGEDGPEGIRVGPGSAVGEAFESMQRTVRSLRDRGVLLAVCSKNNPEDVAAAFARRADMPLKWNDFVAAEVSWQDKATGVRQVAASLGIGLESLVFVDDSPAERAIVRGVLPKVTVLEPPRDPAAYAGWLKSQVHFEKLQINPDDALRAGDYASQRQRDRLRADAGDLDQYLASLETRITVRRATPADLLRVHELFNKTNQFNLTTRRLQLAEVKLYLSQDDARLGVVTATDRFGPMGTVGVFLLFRDGDSAVLDSFLLSCRALGRGVETAVMNCVKHEAVEIFGCRSIDAQFIPTAKNAPASGFLEREGYILGSGLSADREASYRAEGPNLAPRPCPHLRVKHEVEAR